MQRNVQGSKNDGDKILGKSIDTSGNAHSSQYLLKLANEAMKACEEKFKCNVRRVVTDNAMNVTKMRNKLADSTEVDLICY